MKIESAMKETITGNPTLGDAGVVPSGDLKPLPIDSIDHSGISGDSKITTGAASLKDR